MPRMGKTEEDLNGLKLGFLKTVQPNSFSKLISSVCNFKNNAQERYLFVSNLYLCHLRVISLLTLSSIAMSDWQNWAYGKAGIRNPESGIRNPETEPEPEP